MFTCDKDNAYVVESHVIRNSLCKAKLCLMPDSLIESFCHNDDHDHDHNHDLDHDDNDGDDDCQVILWNEFDQIKRNKKAAWVGLFSSIHSSCLNRLIIDDPPREWKGNHQKSE